MTIRPALLDAYRSTVVRIALPAGRVLTITPSSVPAEGTGGAYDLAAGPRPLLAAPRVDVLTACNPGGEAVDAARNAAANRRLLTALQARGVEPPDIRPALGRSPRGARPPWAEPSFALLDVAEPLVLIHARLYGQVAWYRWERGGWSLRITQEPQRREPIPAVGRVSRAAEPLDDRHS